MKRNGTITFTFSYSWDATDFNMPKNDFQLRVALLHVWQDFSRDFSSRWNHLFWYLNENWTLLEIWAFTSFCTKIVIFCAFLNYLEFFIIIITVALWLHPNVGLRLRRSPQSVFSVWSPQSTSQKRSTSWSQWGNGACNCAGSRANLINHCCLTWELLLPPLCQPLLSCARFSRRSRKLPFWYRGEGGWLELVEQQGRCSAGARCRKCCVIELRAFSVSKMLRAHLTILYYLK